MPNFNSNTLVLIPKIDNADSVNDYRPIAIANFKFKLISKIITDRLASIDTSAMAVVHRRASVTSNIANGAGDGDAYKEDNSDSDAMALPKTEV
jgi:hypothetical protein